MQQSFIEEREKPYKEAKATQVLEKHFYLAKPEKTSVENSTCLYSDSFEINTDKSQVNESVQVDQLRLNCII